MGSTKECGRVSPRYSTTKFCEWTWIARFFYNKYARGRSTSSSEPEWAVLLVLEQRGNRLKVFCAGLCDMTPCDGPIVRFNWWNNGVQSVLKTYHSLCPNLFKWMIQKESKNLELTSVPRYVLEFGRFILFSSFTESNNCNEEIVRTSFSWNMPSWRSKHIKFSCSNKMLQQFLQILRENAMWQCN